MPKLIIVEKPVDCKNTKCVLCDELLICWWTGEYYSCARCMARMLRQKSNEITKLEKQIKKKTYHCPECDEPINIKAWDDGSAGLWSHSKHGPNSVCADCNGDDIQCEECGQSPIDRCAGPNTAEQRWCEEHAAWAGWKVAEGGDNSDTEDEDAPNSCDKCGATHFTVSCNCPPPEEDAQCVKCDLHWNGDEGWRYCEEQRWFCPSHSPTCACDEVGCEACRTGLTSDEDDDLIICVECSKDITTECDGRSSFDETGEVICGDCFVERERCEMAAEYEEKYNIQFPLPKV